MTRGTLAYYRLLAERTSLPLMPYNTVGWDAAMFVRLAEVPSIVGVKDPCLDDLPMFRAIQLLGDRLSKTTGQVLHVDGGLSDAFLR